MEQETVTKITSYCGKNIARTLIYDRFLRIHFEIILAHKESAITYSGLRSL